MRLTKDTLIEGKIIKKGATLNIIEAQTPEEQVVEAIRKELKDKGYTSRKVAVKLSYGGTEAMIYVKIKDDSIPKKDIEDIVDKFEKTHKDKFGGITKGGNLFISVSYA